MKETTKKLLDKAADSIEGAELLLNSGKNNISASCSYYAMFYIAEALLFEKNKEFSKHSAVQAAFGKEFAKTKKIDPKFHKYLLEAFESRLEADYGIDIYLNSKAAVELLEKAREFLIEAKYYLKK